MPRLRPSPPHRCRALRGALLLALGLALPAGGTAEGAAETSQGPALRFQAVAEAWNLTFRHHHGGTGELYMPETMGSGVVVLDFDGDGDRDVFFVDSGPIGPGAPPAALPPGWGSRLYRNDGPAAPGGAPRFVDWTGPSGLRVTGYGMGATAGDVDGDGDLDLYVTAFGANQLFENRGDGTFEDVTDRAGVGDPLWSTSAAFADPDRDGDLDLYVTNYVDFTVATNKACLLKNRDDLRSYCHPDVYAGQQDTYYENLGDGRFREATAAAGFEGADGKGLGVVFADLDDDGGDELYVANDMTPNLLYRRRAAPAGEPSSAARFEEVGLLSGVALSHTGVPEAGMGVEAEDLDGDGWTDLFVTHLDRQTNAFYGGTDARIFVDRRFVARLAEPSLNRVGFGTAGGDLDQDGDLDLVVANGHILHNAEEAGTGTTYRQANQLFENRDGRFAEVDAGLDAVRASRGLALGDLDGDGDLDLVISNSDDLAEVYENTTAENRSEAGGWLQLDLPTPAGAPAVGTRAWRRGGGAEGALPDLRRQVRTGSSYLSQNDASLHFGLGPGGADTFEGFFEIHWAETATGAAQGSSPTVRYRGLPTDRRLTVYPPSAPGSGPSADNNR